MNYCYRVDVKQWNICYKNIKMDHLDKKKIMICPLCGKLEVRRLRIEKGKEIFVCGNCELGFLSDVNKTVHQQPIDPSLYDFEGYKKEEKKLRRRFAKLIERIVRYKKSGKVLDVGAGFGLFSSILQKKGNFHFDLIDPLDSFHYINIIKSKVFRSTFERFKKAKKQSYDIIIMLDVLEHFKDPLKNLKKARLLLKPAGILVIQTPNYKSLMARICKDWAWWMVEDHKFFFSPKSMKLMLHKVGFEIKYFTTYEDWQDFKKNLDGNFEGVKNNFVRRVIKGIFFTFFIPFYFLVRWFFWKSEYGGLMFLITGKE